MNYSDFHKDNILNVERLDADRQQELFGVIEQGTDKFAAEQAYDPTIVRDDILEGVYYHLAAYQEAANDDALAAHAEIVATNMPLVKFVTGKYRYALEYIEEEDLIQEGYAAMSLAAWRFDQSEGRSFAALAIPHIKGRILTILDARNSPVRVPANITGAARTVRREMPEISQRVDRSEEDINKIAELVGGLGLAEAVWDYEANLRHVRSLDESFGRPVVEYFDYDGQPNVRAPFNDITDQLLADPHTTEMEEEIVLAVDTASQANTLLDYKDLNEREKAILKLRAGYRGGEPLTLQEIAEEYGVTRARIRQIETVAQAKLRLASQSGNTVTKQPASAYISEENALEIVKANQSIYHAWGQFLDVVCGKRGSRPQRQVERKELEALVAGIAAELYDYKNPAEDHPHLGDLNNNNRDPVSVVLPPDVGNKAVAKKIITRFYEAQGLSGSSLEARIARDLQKIKASKPIKATRYVEPSKAEKQAHVDIDRAEELDYLWTQFAGILDTAWQDSYRWGIQKSELEEAARDLYGFGASYTESNSDGLSAIESMRRRKYPPDVGNEEVVLNLVAAVLQKNHGKSSAEAARIIFENHIKPELLIHTG